jgi:hypothetical protein
MLKRIDSVVNAIKGGANFADFANRLVMIREVKIKEESMNLVLSSLNS